MRCKNCKEPIVDASDEIDPEPEWTHSGSLSWRCRDDSGNHAEPEEN
jgi:hypothetical protein